MSCAVSFRRPAAYTTAVCDEASTGHLAKPEIVLPVLGRSAALLQPLLRERALDLELADCVVALDPGLTFGVLQRARLEGNTRGSGAWRLPLALVASGRTALQDLLDSAPRLESPGDPGVVPQLLELVRNAVVRGSLAHWLSRELGRCNPRKAFLAGLLAEIPQMAALSCAGRGGRRPRNSASFADRLSSELVGVASDQNNPQDPNGPFLAITRIAEVLRQNQAVGRAPASVDPADWYPWLNRTANDWHLLADHASNLACWASENLYRLAPWDFMSRLERRKPWV